ncbi:MAG: sigma-70 family RNA polymerase sigma factor [Gemmatimonadetes bacterium]|nr:sigma-70 family RNA polymerase sigma factor [Gemmatimonadota bacterium]
MSPGSLLSCLSDRDPRRNQERDRTVEAQGEITVLLHELSGGDHDALSRLLPRVYDELRAIARSHMAHERPGHTLNATAVVHEAYLRLAELERMNWQDRNHFFAVASQAMRRVLVNHAVARNTLKRGGQMPKTELSENLGFDQRDLDSILALHQALDRLRQLEPRQVRVVECRFFGGMSVEETAAGLGLSTATVKRDWAVARAWLNHELAHE